MTFYHVDRENKLKEEQILKLFKFEDFYLPKDFGSDTHKTLQKAFPDGISMHGDGFLLADGAVIFREEGVNRDQSIDLIFELVRKAYFPEKPSRWQSLFAVDSIEKAKEFTTRVNWNQDFPIWEVEASEFLKVDMNLLNLDGRNIDIYQRAFAYWNGETLDDKNPYWEYLLKYPVKVIKRVA